MSEFTKYLMERIKRRLSENFQMILSTSGMAKAHWLLKRVDLLKLQDRTTKSIEKHEESKYVYTDNNGSFFNKEINPNTLVY